ncbi:hypothetical protein FACS1894163_13280 [Spirochaetia bacterium]|nr:hypothetical protein FACS1894163_13280 [Spirochaetia bacterium]
MKELKFSMGDIQTAFQPEAGGAWYPRMIVLSNGEWICGFDTNEDGGNGVIKVVISGDEGASWSQGILAASENGASLANAQLAQRKDGQIWLAYRVVLRRGEATDTILRISSSDDNGRTWQILPNGDIALASSEQFKGVWEPHMGYIGNTFVVMYANDDLAVVDHGGQQMLYMKKWEETGWSKEPIVVANGKESNSRDGMPVWSRMKDGRYIVVFEATDENVRYPFVIKYKISRNGLDWNVPRHSLYLPEKRMKQGGAPYVITLSDGRLAASLQSDDDKARYGVEACTDKIYIADPKAASWQYLCDPFPTGDGTQAVWNSLAPLSDGSFIALSSTNYPGPGSRIVWRRIMVD